MKLLFSAIVTVFLSFSALSLNAQETETKVIDEVVAVVNEGVITLSKVKREMKNIEEVEVQQGKDRATVKKQVADKQGELIANLINEELMVQRAKELGLDKEADLEVNQRFAAIMKENGIKKVEDLYREMEKTGVNPTDIREMWRKQAIRDLIIQREVQSKLYWEPTATQVKEYFEKNKTKFTKPETVTLSEIFLSFAGRDEAAVRAKAKALVTQLRAGGDFEKAAVENSERQNAATTKGKVDTFDIKQLDPKFANAVQGMKKGGVTDPIDLDGVGVTILRVDERADASAESFFDERNVRTAMMNEKMPARHKEFMSKLRQDAYIKISDTYRPLVAPALFEEERKAKTDK